MQTMRYCKDIAKLLFWELWACLLTQSQSDTINLKKTFVFICNKKNQLHSPRFSEDIVKIKTSYFGYFGHASLWTPKMIISACGKLWCLFACQKLPLIITSLLRYYILKNIAIWLLTAFRPIAREPEFSQIWDWWWNISNYISFHFRLFPGKTNDKIFQKI